MKIKTSGTPFKHKLGRMVPNHSIGLGLGQPAAVVAAVRPACLLVAGPVVAAAAGLPVADLVAGPVAGVLLVLLLLPVAVIAAAVAHRFGHRPQ